MKWLYRLERRFGRFGVPNLIVYIVAGRGLAYILSLRNPEFPYHLVLDPDAVGRGEFWRLLTYVFLPPSAAGNVFAGPVMALLALYVTFLIGHALEETWGSFKFTLYYLIGVVATSLVAFLVSRAPVSPYFIDLSLFLAFATVFPDFSFLLFFIIPFKAKWMGWIAAVFLAAVFALAGVSGKLAIAVSLSNYLLFFGDSVAGWIAAPFGRSRRGPGARLDPAVHKCSVCRLTERDDPELEFRVCACPKCGEGREFCMEHLRGHLDRRET
jgi:membrane associated rhomboid family serine protease